MHGEMYTDTKTAPHSGSAALARAVIVQRREFANRFVNCSKTRKLERVVSRALATGYRLHAKDPRTACLFELAREAAVSGV